MGRAVLRFAVKFLVGMLAVWGVQNLIADMSDYTKEVATARKLLSEGQVLPDEYEKFKHAACFGGPEARQVYALAAKQGMEQDKVHGLCKSVETRALAVR